MGAPTKFNAKKLKIAKGYLAKHIKDKTLPTIEELAVEYLEIDDETVTEWQKPHADDDNKMTQMRRELSATIKRLMNYQKRHLKVQGLAGKVNPGMAIFLLKANHGYVETSRQEHTGKDGEDLTPLTILYTPTPLPENYDEPSSDKANS